MISRSQGETERAGGQRAGGQTERNPARRRSACVNKAPVKMVSANVVHYSRSKSSGAWRLMPRLLPTCHVPFKYLASGDNVPVYL